jgi:hypothetical protein
MHSRQGPVGYGWGYDYQTLVAAAAPRLWPWVSGRCCGKLLRLTFYFLIRIFTFFFIYLSFSIPNKGIYDCSYWFIKAAQCTVSQGGKYILIRLKYQIL